jgi:hypothetical protein
MQSDVAIEAYTTEARLPPESLLVGEPVGALQALSEDRVPVASASSLGNVASLRSDRKSREQDRA